MADFDPIRAKEIEGAHGEKPFWVKELEYETLDGKVKKGNLSVHSLVFDDMLGTVIRYDYSSLLNGVGNNGMDAILEALHFVESNRDSNQFLILMGNNDQFHAGGNLDETRKEMANGDANHLMNWAWGRPAWPAPR